MRYEVFARDDWDTDLQKEFGDPYSIHELSDAQVIAAIIRHGRAKITELSDPPLMADGKFQLEFQNGYD